MGAKLNFDNMQPLQGSNEIILSGFSIILSPLLHNVPSGFAIKALIQLIAHNTIMNPIADLDTQLVRLQIHILGSVIFLELIYRKGFMMHFWMGIQEL